MGQIDWLRQFGTLGPANGFANAVGSDGSIYVVGGTNGALPGQTSAGANDAFVRKYDASGNVQWTDQFGTSLGDQALGVSVHSSAVYVVGQTNGTLPGQTSAGSADAFVRKYDGSGNVLWTRQFGSTTSTGNEVARGVFADSSGVYMVGATTHAFPGETNPSPGMNDAFIIKYDASGNVLWTRQFGTSGADQAFGVHGDASGVYVVGVTNGSLSGANQGGNDAFVRKYDANGNVLWTSQFGTAAGDEARGVTVDSTGAYVVGLTDGSLSGSNQGGNDAFVRKYDANGNALWTDQFGTAGGPDEFAFGVAADATGVYVAGQTDGTLPGQTAAGGIDAFVRKYDGTGNVLWTRQFGSPGSPARDQANGVLVDSSGVYVVGQTSGALPGQTSSGGFDAFVRKYDVNGNTGDYTATPPDETNGWTRQFDASGGPPAPEIVLGVTQGSTYVAGGTGGTLPGETSAGLNDAFLRKYDEGGNVVWTRQFGTAGFEEIRGVSAHSSAVSVAGITSRSFPGHSNPAEGTFDAFVRLYDADGNELWTRQFGTPMASSADLANGVSMDSSGIYVVGQTSGALAGQTNQGGSDAFVRKYDSSGNVTWTDQFGSSVADQALKVATDSSGVYVVGATEGALPGQSNAGGIDAWVRKYDAGGNVIWTRQFGTSAGEQALNVAADASGIYVVGFTAGSLSGSNQGVNDAYLRKYDASGNVLWTRQFGTSDADLARGVSLAPLGLGLYVVGQTAGTLPGQSNAGGIDTFVRKYSTAGSEIWTLQFGSSGNDVAFAAAASNLCSVTVGGQTTGILAGTRPPLDVSTDGFVAKISECSVVEIDIKPGSFPNSINLGSNGVVPVAILSTAMFDASTVDPATVYLASAPVKLKGKGTPQAALEDVNGDGLPDLVVHVSTEALQLSAADTEAVLEGETTDGKHIRGNDSVRIVP